MLLYLTEFLGRISVGDEKEKCRYYSRMKKKIPVLFPYEKESTPHVCSHTQNRIELSSPLDHLV